jgi:hypothetical protein
VISSLQYAVLQVVNTVEEALDKEGEKVVLVGHSVSARLQKRHKLVNVVDWTTTPFLRMRCACLLVWVRLVGGWAVP